MQDVLLLLELMEIRIQPIIHIHMYMLQYMCVCDAVTMYISSHNVK